MAGVISKIDSKGLSRCNIIKAGALLLPHPIFSKIQV